MKKLTSELEMARMCEKQSRFGDSNAGEFFDALFKMNKEFKNEEKAKSQNWKKIKKITLSSHVTSIRYSVFCLNTTLMFGINY